MTHRSSIFGKLSGSQGSDIFNPIDCLGIEITTKFLIPKDSETLFESQLEPVATGDTISSPIVEIFMSNHSFDSFKIGICRRFLIGQDIGGIEHIQTLIFHGTHIKVIHSNNIVNIQIILESIFVFIPFHGSLE
mmetsp:Transcript_39581/g.114554  ORF Transcript_39581/g.114554 Transcript_39581/m.114554 type:complete len:134 (+) Transcript_39581:372-773(+)